MVTFLTKIPMSKFLWNDSCGVGAIPNNESVGKVQL